MEETEEKGKESGVSGASGDAGPNATTPEESPLRPGASEPGSRRKNLSSESILSTPAVEPRWSSSSLDKVLGVLLVAKKLLPFLNLEDLKSLSRVSWGTLHTVRRLSNFSNLARLHLSPRVMDNGLLKLGEGNNFVWKHLSFDILGRDRDIPIGFLDSEPLRDALEAAESLNIHHGSWYSSLGEDLQYSFLRLEGVMKKTRKLKVLGLELEILNQEPHPEFFISPYIQQVLRGLHGLVILGCRRRRWSRISEGYYSMKLEDGSEPGSNPIHQNMLQLSKSIRGLTKFSFEPSLIHSDEKKLAPGKFIKPIITANRRSLKVLELCANFLEEVDDFKSVHCPNLKSLKFKADGRFTFLVEHFLMAQPPLTELGIFLDEKCDFHFLPGLAEQGKLDKLERLHLKADRYMFLSTDEDPNLDIPVMDWHFLNGLTSLNEFLFMAPCTKSQAWNGAGKEILRWLPPTTEKISLKGLSRFWKTEGNIGLLLSRFQNLSELDLLGSVDTVTDEGMQSLIVNCPKLTSLTISWCKKLTDFGVTGVRVLKRVEERSGISLDQLQELKHLKIRDCFEVSREGLLSVLKFEQLKSFEYRDYIRYEGWFKELCGRLACCFSLGDFLTDTAFISRVIRQNPSLEEVVMCPFDPGSDHKDDHPLARINSLYSLESELRRSSLRLNVVDLNRRRMVSVEGRHIHFT